MKFSLKQLLVIVAMCCLQTAFICNLIENWGVMFAGLHEVADPTIQSSYYAGINGALLVAAFIGSVYFLSRVKSR